MRINQKKPYPRYTTAERDILSNIVTDFTIYNSTDNEYQIYKNPDWISISGGVEDHDELGGLSDDDHSQYALLSGRSGDVLNIDVINEDTEDTGVTIEEVVLKEGSVNLPNGAEYKINGVNILTEAELLAIAYAVAL